MRIKSTEIRDPPLRLLLNLLFFPGQITLVLFFIMKVKMVRHMSFNFTNIFYCQINLQVQVFKM